MEQYISKDAIVAEIDNRIYRRKKEYNILEESEIWEDALKLKERINELVDLRTQILFNTLDTLEVKEVDLEKEFDNYANGILACDIQFEPFTHLYNCAKYFFELGMQQSKNDNNNEE